MPELARIRFQLRRTRDPSLRAEGRRYLSQAYVRLFAYLGRFEQAERWFQYVVFHGGPDPTTLVRLLCASWHWGDHARATAVAVMLGERLDACPPPMRRVALASARWCLVRTLHARRLA
jgi:hypothetical protein